MSERKRDPGDGSNRRMFPANKKPRRTPVNTNLSLPPSSRAEDGRGGAEEENTAAAQQGTGGGVESRTLDLISSINRPAGTSSADHAGPRTLDLISGIGRTGMSSSNDQAGGGDGQGCGSAPPPLPQGGNALNAMGPGIFSGNAAGMMPAPIPGGATRPPPPRPVLSPAERLRIGRGIQAYLSYAGNRQRLVDFAMQHPSRATPSSGRSLCWPGGNASSWTGDQRGKASTSRGITLQQGASSSNPQAQGASSSNLHAQGSSSSNLQVQGASSSNLQASAQGASSSNLQAPAKASVPAAAGQPVAATGASGWGGKGKQVIQPQAKVSVLVNCPYCHKRFPNSACCVCANVAAGGPHQRNPYHPAGRLPIISEQRLRHIVEVAKANQLGRPVGQPAAAEAVGSHLHQPQPLPLLQPQPLRLPLLRHLPPTPPVKFSTWWCPHCTHRQGTYVPPVLERGWEGHFCLCSVCKNKPGALCLTCVVRGWFP